MKDEQPSIRFAITELKMLWIIVVAVFFFGGWCATLEWRTHTMLERMAEQTRDITANAAKVNAVEIWRAATDASRWTSQDQVGFANQVSKDISQNAQRITTVEAGIASIKEGQVAMTKQVERLADIIQRRTP